MSSSERRAGGETDTVELMRGPFCSVAVVLLLATSRADAAAPSVSVVVRAAADDRYVVEAAFDVSASPEVAWGVLTDYDRTSDFVKSVTRSVVRERGPAHIVVEQDGVARVLFFSRRAQVVLWVTEEPHRAIRFRDICARDFKSYEGRWELSPRPGGVRVSYALSAALKSQKPAFLMRGGMQRSTQDLLEQVRTEMGRRSRGVHGSRSAFASE
jgi:hypothetical protein